MIRISFTSGDINALLGAFLPPDANVWLEGGEFQIEYKTPLGTARALAQPSFRGNDLVIALPFSRIKAPLFGGLAGTVTRMLWGTISEKGAGVVASQLRKQGLPSDTVEISKGMDEYGQTVGLIEIHFDKVHPFLDKKLAAAPVVIRVTDMRFEAGGIETVIDVLPAARDKRQSQPSRPNISEHAPPQ